MKINHLERWTVQSPRKKCCHIFFRVTANNQLEAASVKVKECFLTITMKTMVIPLLPAHVYRSVREGARLSSTVASIAV
jgi:hypothetical protein